MHLGGGGWSSAASPTASVAVSVAAPGAAAGGSTLDATTICSCSTAVFTIVPGAAAGDNDRNLFVYILLETDGRRARFWTPCFVQIALAVMVADHTQAWRGIKLVS